MKIFRTPSGAFCRVIRYSSWIPSPEEREPDISFTGSRFRRRLSVISMMTIRVIHDIMPLDTETKLYFVSFRGEVNRQFTINKMLIQDGAIFPAAFSLSVFNTPPALASMALGLTAGYSAVYPGKNNFRSSLLGAAASLDVAARTQKPARLVFVYADEALIPEYCSLVQEPPPALAFAVLFDSATEAEAEIAAKAAVEGALPLDSDSPGDFLAVLAAGKPPASGGDGA
jgi:hypothetical protein